MSTGMPAGIWLGKFGANVRDYFGHVRRSSASRTSSSSIAERKSQPNVAML